MTKKEKLIIALTEIDSLTELLHGNEYQQFLYGHLIQMQVEIRRQLSFYE